MLSGAKLCDLAKAKNDRLVGWGRGGVGNRTMLSAVSTKLIGCIFVGQILALPQGTRDYKIIVLWSCAVQASDHPWTPF